MGLPENHDVPVLLPMNRTIKNYEDIKKRAGWDGPFEVTQLINSFSAVVAHPWDQLLDKGRLKETPIDDAMGFPMQPPFPDEGGNDTDTVYNLLRLLRNGMAHGNMTLLSLDELLEHRKDGTPPPIREREIAGIRIWNMRRETETWSTVLDIREMEATLKAMMRLCESRELWKQNIRKDYEQRRPPTERAAG